MKDLKSKFLEYFTYKHNKEVFRDNQNQVIRLQIYEKIH